MPILVKGAGRRRLAGWCMGAGFGGFFGQAFLSTTGLFGTAETVARPVQGYVHPIVVHGTTRYVSSGQVLLSYMVFGFWLLALIGILLAPKRTGQNGRPRRALDDPDGTVRRWIFVGVATTLVLRLCATPLAEGLIRLGWLHLRGAG